MIPRTPTYREVTPPLPVTINLDQAIARDNPPLRSANPLWVTAYSIKLDRLLPRDAARLAAARHRGLARGVLLHRAQPQQRRPPRPPAMGTGQRHHPQNKSHQRQQRKTLRIVVSVVPGVGSSRRCAPPQSQL